jgi:hypothetical protein
MSSAPIRADRSEDRLTRHPLQCAPGHNGYRDRRKERRGRRNNESITLADGHCAQHRRGVGFGGALLREVALPFHSGMTARATDPKLTEIEFDKIGRSQPRPVHREGGCKKKAEP